MNYREAIDWLFSTQTFGIKLGLDGPRQLLREFLAFPEHGVQVIHVAGTNGKGSTCAMIESIARATGSRCGLFTSPHLIDYRERIQVNGERIPEEDCAAMLTELRSICEGFEHHPTFFEITLALAMRWFRSRRCELIVLETGMGGRLDATTAVPADVCVITPIGMDHQQWLGDTLADIAREKAGIFVEGKPAVSSPQEQEARAVLEKEANQRRSALNFIREPLLGYTPAISGEHQRWNAALAVEALHLARFPLNSDVIRQGLNKVKWPGRFERIRPNIILDGAHNPHAAASLADTWREMYRDEKATLIFGAVCAKDIPGMLKLLCPIAARILFCPVDSPRATPVEELIAALPDEAPPHSRHEDLKSAIQAAKTHDQPTLIAGSLFLVGAARALFTQGDYQVSEQ